MRFNMNGPQKRLYNQMWYRNVIPKARQLGMTTFIQLFILDRCLFEDNTNAGIIAHTAADARKFFDEKIKYAYDNLPAEIKAYRPATNDNAGELKFSNGSRITVGVSLRSGTLQYLHVSEFGKLCAENPLRAQEVIAGALNTVTAGMFIFVESTAEGSSGHFADMVKRARALTRDLTPLDYKLHFFPWWQDPSYALHGVNIPLPEKMKDYFKQLEAEHDIELTDPQRMWYVIKAEEQGEKMRQEFPATIDEAFEKLLKGAILAVQMRKVRGEGRICDLPIVRGIPVNTFWDLGRNDNNVIWLHQHVAPWDHFIGYYKYRLVDLSHYVEWLGEWRQEHGAVFGRHYLPHDVDVTDLSSLNNESRREILERLGLKPIVKVDRIQSLNDGIEMLRNSLSTCKFDEKACAEGIEDLENYAWTWDKEFQQFRQTPMKNGHQHGADGLRQFAQGFKGSQTSFADQLAKATGQGGKRAYQGKKGRNNPLTNPSTDHVV